MGRFILNSLTLKLAGIRLLPDEKVKVAVELEGGLTEELENNHATLLLTNKRLIRYSMAGHKSNLVSAALDDIDSIEVIRRQRNRQWVGVGSMFIAGGLLLGALSLLLLASPISPLLMAFALAMIGVVFILTYAGGHSGEVIVRAGVKEIKSKMQSKALDDMELFVQRFYELKLGYPIESDASEVFVDDEDGEAEVIRSEPAGTASEV